MATGVIKLDSIDEVFDKAAKSIHRKSSHLSHSDRSSSGVSSESSSPIGTPSVTSFSNPVADILEDRRAYNNPALQLDPSELVCHNVTTRNVCTGVVSLRDELWLDIEAHLQPQAPTLPPTTTRTLAEKCRHFVQSKWRSIPLSMLPVKEANGDQRPLSPPDKGDKDENANQTTPKPPAPTAATTPSTSRGDAAAASSKTEATAKDPDAAPPFSCTPVYIVILLAIFVVLVVGAITTIIDMRPEFIYGPRTNVTQELVNVTVPP